MGKWEMARGAGGEGDEVRGTCQLERDYAAFIMSFAPLLRTFYSQPGAHMRGGRMHFPIHTPAARAEEAIRHFFILLAPFLAERIVIMG